MKIHGDDWQKTGKRLQFLREHNVELRRCVCSELKHDKTECSGKCDKCEFELDNHISRKELSEVFGVSESVIFNWENGRTPVDYEDLLFYEQLSKKNVNEIVILQGQVTNEKTYD